MLNRIFQQKDVPREYRTNFMHFYFDIAWFGILSGSAVNFLNVYAARLGASSAQIGFLAAASAVVNLLIAIPTARWLEKQNTNRAIFWSSVFYRLGYALWIPLPWIFGAQGQIWALIGITFLMAIPLTPLGVGFNALFAEAVPTKYRAHVAGTRNVAFAFTYMASSLLSGYILDTVTFPIGYQIVFAIGFFGAAMSSVHLYFIKPIENINPPQTPPEPTPTTQAESTRGISSSLRLDILRGPFQNILVVMLIFHFAHYIPTPVYALFSINELHLTDNHIGIGTALFYFTMFIGSTQLNRVVGKFGHKAITGWGMIGLALYPLLLAISHQVWHFYLVSLVGGFTWAMTGGAYANYMLEHIPAHDRPSHLAWYNMALNAAILSSAFIGPLIANWSGLAYSMVIFGVMRILAGVVVLRWG